MGDDTSYLKQQVKEWGAKVKNLIDTPVPAAMAKEKESLVAFARKIYITIQKIFGGVDELAPLKNELGFLPIIIGGAIFLGAGAAITKWTLDYKKFMAKVAEQQRLEAGGMSPAQAANIVKRTYSDPTIWSQIAGSATPFILLGGGLWFLSRNNRG